MIFNLIPNEYKTIPNNYHSMIPFDPFLGTLMHKLVVSYHKKPDIERKQLDITIKVLLLHVSYFSCSNHFLLMFPVCFLIFSYLGLMGPQEPPWGGPRFFRASPARPPELARKNPSKPKLRKKQEN